MTSNKNLQSAIQGTNWTQIPGSASLAAAADGSLWVLSTGPAGNDKYIWHYANGSWTNISGLASRLAVGPSGALYAINSGGGIYSYSGTWTAFGGGASDITVAANGSLYVLSNASIAGSDPAIWHYTNGWSQVPGAGVRIAASWDTNGYAQSNGTLSPGGFYILSSAGNVYYENIDSSFVQLPGAASAIAPTTMGGIFVLSYPANANGNSIFYNDLATPGWTQQAGTGVSLSTNGSNLYAIATSGGIFVSPIRPKLTEYPIPSARSLSYFITAGPDGALWFSELSASRIGRITTAGAFTEYSIPTADGQPQGITAGPDGALWFTETSNSTGIARIGRVTTSGAFTEYVNPVGSSPRITTGPDGALWFTGLDSGQIGRVTTSGVFTTYTIPTARSGPYGITTGPDGALWFTEISVGKIGRVTISGAFTEFSIPFANGQPVDITTGSDGALWFAEEYGNIGRVTTSGAFTEYPLSFASDPVGITTGPDGALWFTEYDRNKVGRLTTSGLLTEYTIPTANSTPYGITAGPDGALWFTELANNIGRVSPL